MDSDSKVLVAGANGMVGSAIIRNLKSKGYTNIIKGNGTPRKVMNVDRIKALGWKPKISLRQGIEKTYEWYKTR